jgi:mono/diheme cytochrome c family protein
MGPKDALWVPFLRLVKVRRARQNGCVFRVKSILFAAAIMTATAVSAADDFFTKQVQPIFQEHCFKCHSHSSDKIKGGLVLDSLDGMLTGGDSGPALVPGDVEKSLLVKAIRYKDEDLQMPPKDKKLSDAQIAAIEQWVKDGAKWPGQTGGAKRARGKITDEDRQWWAFQPLSKPAVPKVEDRGWARNDIDRFIFEKLQQSRLRPAVEAPRSVLARRLYFDIWGLPPTPEELDDFVSDNAPDAYEKLVDKLLASPRYGERWARHWLDLVRYADSDGYRIDDFRPTAWRYRDYIINAFNHDKPYDEFVREQIAGDEMMPRTPERLIATGYLRMWIYEYNNRDVVGQWNTILNDLTDTTGDVFLGLGLQCARCHDHKFDPILQKDYYRLQAFFAPFMPREDIDVATDAERAEYETKLATWREKTADLRGEISVLEEPYRRKAANLILVKFPEETLAMIEKPVAQRTPWEHQIADLAYRQVDYEYGRFQTTIKGADKEKHVALLKKLAQFEEFKPAPLARALIATDVGPFAPPVLIPKKSSEPIEPGLLTILNEKPAEIRPAFGLTNSTGRRTELARWLTDAENPLTTRVIVNRVWQYHFGRGLVGTSSDFGRLGEKPSHPELLDWLARRFVQNGWSFKKLHRLILTSAAYRQASSTGSKTVNSESVTSGAQKLDPENRLLWRASVRRLDAEQIRDSILAATGELELDAGGPPVDSFKPRRSIYNKVMRNNRDPLLDVFDAPQHFASASQRDTTTTPVQSLLLINSQYMLQRAQAMAGRLQKSGAKSDEEMVSQAYRLTLGRAPTSEESATATTFLREQQARVDLERASSAAAGFIAEKIPYRDGKGALMSPKSVQERLMVPHNDSLPLDTFTIEAFVVLRTLYDGAQVRTIASHWSGKNNEPGWSFGVTSLKSMRRPQTLVLQLTGKDANGRAAYEPVFSDLHINLNKPYFVAATVSLSDTNEVGITFYAKDLSNDDEPMQVAKVPHHVVSGVRSTVAFTIGGRAAEKEHLWDGPIDDVRLSRTALKQEQLLLTSEGITSATCGYWQFEPKPSVFRDASPNKNDIKPMLASRAITVDRKTAALTDLCHVLLNANEFLYVE